MPTGSRYLMGTERILYGRARDYGRGICAASAGVFGGGGSCRVHGDTAREPPSPAPAQAGPFRAFLRARHCPPRAGGRTDRQAGRWLGSAEQGGPHRDSSPRRHARGRAVEGRAPHRDPERPFGRPCRSEALYGPRLGKPDGPGSRCDRPCRNPAGAIAGGAEALRTSVRAIQKLCGKEPRRGLLHFLAAKGSRCGAAPKRTTLHD